jgi:hypothetical protein
VDGNRHRKGDGVGKTVGKVMGVQFIVHESIPSPQTHPTLTHSLFQTQLQIQPCQQQYPQPVISISKITIAATTSKTASLDTKPTSKDLANPKAAEKANVTVKLGRRM